MCKKLIYLVFFMLALGVAQGAGLNWDRAAYWDGRYPTNWADAATAANVRDALDTAGYTILDADELKTWMLGHIADGELSVVVFCMDIAPDTVIETMSDTCTLRQYLDAGGKIVFYADIPFYNQGHADGTTTIDGWRDAAAPAILGFNTSSAPRDNNNAVQFTPDGIEWGLTETWSSVRPAAAGITGDLTVLATDNAGHSAAWVKHYVPGDTYRGFVRTRDVGGMPNVDDIIRLAEFADMEAGNPTPADGSAVAPTVHELNVYMMLDYTPGRAAVSHTAYFSDNIDDVISRDEAHSLGSEPPWPLVDEEAFVVGYDDDAIEEFARAPLVFGETYYWCVDVWDGEQTWPGAVWSFIAMGEKAWGPTPPDGESHGFVPSGSDLDLIWNLGDLDMDGYLNKVTYKVYFGTDETDLPLLDSMEPNTCVVPGTALDPDTTYYWRVDEIRRENSVPFPAVATEGDVWSFTTMEAVTITDPSLVGYYKLDGEVWGTVFDYSGYGNHGSLVGDMEYVAGYEGNALDFDGVGDYVDFGNPATYPAGTSARTMCAWAKTDSVAAGWSWIAAYGSPGTSQAMFIGRNGADLFGGGYGDDISLVGFWDIGVWHHICLTYDGATARLYADGLEVNSMAKNWDLVRSMARLGRQVNSAAEFWNGLVDEMRIYDRALSQGEIDHLMDVTKAWDPRPADGEVDVALGSKLTWKGGMDAGTGSEYTEFDVYFSTSFEEVDSESIAPVPISGANEYTPTFSHYDRCYWKVNEIGSSVVTGDVWSFKAIYNPANVADPRLKLWLQLDGDPCDSSGHGRDGTEIGGPVYVPGYDGEAIYLDGVDDYVDVEYSVGISGAEPRTIAGWAKATTTAIVDWTNLFGFTGPSGAGGHFDIEIVGATDSTTAGYYGLHMYGDEYDIMPCDLEWHHLAATFDGAQASWYADGVQMGFATFAINTPGNVHVGRRDDNTNYFPGTIDDVRIYDYVLNATQIATVMRINLAWAWNPNPGNGATGVARTPILTWTGGDYATSHYVFFGTDEDALPQVAGPQPTASYNPGTLDLGTTYYWAIGEANAAAPPDYMDRGRTWKFTTVDYLVIDNMDAYVPYDVPAGPHIFVAWRDGKGDCAGSGNNTGANLLETTPALFATSQLMQYDWDNDGFVLNPCTGTADDPRPYYYSKIEAQVAGLPSGIGSNWTMGGVKALSLLFYGDTLNSINDPLWVQLSDSSGPGEKVEYGAYADESLADIQDPAWHEWLIDLNDFDVQLTNVVSIAIGIGDENATGPHISSGTLYIDDVRLYTPRCIPSRNTGGFADADYAPVGAPDCVVNYKELKIMGQDWAQFDYNVYSTPPASPNLVASYQFENNANDGSPNGNHGTEQGGPIYAISRPGMGMAISCDGVDDYVDCGNDPSVNITDAVSVSAWINVSIPAADQKIMSTQNGSTGGYKMGVFTNDKVEFEVRNSANQDTLNRGVAGGTVLTAGVWYHVVGVYSQEENFIRTYVDGNLDRELATTAVLGASSGNLTLGRESFSDQYYFGGSIDDLRIYNYALSHGEVRSILGLPTLYVPVSSPANISDDEPATERKVNFLDYAELMDFWGMEQEWPSW